MFIALAMFYVLRKRFTASGEDLQVKQQKGANVTDDIEVTSPLREEKEYESNGDIWKPKGGRRQ